MNKRAFLLAIVSFLFGVFSTIHAEPKAYEIVKYHGKAGGVAITFNYADGYSEASDMKVTSGGKTTAFNINVNVTGDVKFTPAKPGGAIKSVTLKMDLEDRTLDRIKGSYVTGGRAVPFMLTRSK